MEQGHGAHLPIGVAGDSLTPHVHERISVADEVARMNRGRGRIIWGSIAALGALGVAAALTIKVIGAQELRDNAYAAIRTADETHAQNFLRCALPGTDPSRVTTSATLMSMIERSGQRLGPRAASRIGECLPELAVLISDVQSMRVPDDAKDELVAVQVAAAELTTAWSAYQAFITTAPVDDVNALPHMDEAAQAWTTYVKQRAALEKALLPPLSQ